MKIQFEGKIIGCRGFRAADAPGVLEILYEGKPEGLFTMKHINPNPQVKVTLEHETPIEACLLCGGEEVVSRQCVHPGEKWSFVCSQCSTAVYIKASTREEAIQYFNQGEPRC